MPSVNMAREQQNQTPDWPVPALCYFWPGAVLGTRPQEDGVGVGFELESQGFEAGSWIPRFQGWAGP